MKKLHQQLLEIATKIANQSEFNASVSASNVGWHIEHLLLTINLVIEAVKKSNPENYKRTFSLMQMAIFATKKIPRGKAKSPKVVVPKTYNEETLHEHLQLAKANLSTLENLNPNKYFAHPIFGHLKLAKTIRFLEIHTSHHMYIIQDILHNKTT